MDIFLVKHHGKISINCPLPLGDLGSLTADYEKLLEGFDILITPTLTTPPKIGFFGPEVDGETHWQRINEYLPFTKYQNISGSPAITLPCSSDSEGLPIGIQFASRLGEDRLLNLVMFLEEVLFVRAYLR